MPSEIVNKYFRTNKLPQIWCPGCGHGIITRAITVAIDKLGLDRDKICIVSGIGCSSRAPGYMDFDTLHTTHGRALAFATGIKMANPELKVIVITGDGDATAIGGNHLIHACRRNIDITTIIYNNNIYGMTGGQYSPTTPKFDKGTTVPYGNVDKAFDIPALAIAAGATYVGRSTAYHTQLLISLIENGIKNEGFSLIEAISVCPTYYGRKNKKGSAVEMLEWQKEHAVNIAAASKMTPESLDGKFLIGEFKNSPEPEYTREYQKIIDRLKRSEKMGKYEIRLSGSGGQGLITGGIILAEAAILDGKNAVQTQSYGPEARGGASKAEVIISTDKIDFPKVRDCDIFLSLTQKSFDQYGKNVKENGIIIVDESIDTRNENKVIYSLPIIDTAYNVLGKPMVLNIVALGVIAAITNVVSRNALEEAVLNRVPKGTEELNKKALEMGYSIGKNAIK